MYSLLDMDIAVVGALSQGLGRAKALTTRAYVGLLAGFTCYTLGHRLYIRICIFLAEAKLQRVRQVTDEIDRSCRIMEEILMMEAPRLDTSGSLETARASLAECQAYVQKQREMDRHLRQCIEAYHRRDIPAF